jgi:hypothetical protein
MKTLKLVTTVLTIGLGLGVAVGLSSHATADSSGEPGRASGEKNPLKNVYFGEQHLHTTRAGAG